MQMQLQKKKLRGEREIDSYGEREKRQKNPSKIPCIGKTTTSHFTRTPPLPLSLSLSFSSHPLRKISSSHLGRRNYGLAPNASSSALTPSSVLIFFN